ncbi:MAG TPA: hypothetical protein VE954_33850 [Oligoflexus sp.]|uniref:hypothetical protein n=1 Tax=Oligoflexus sp. TaxID=1971216 RepID=UPI002D653714|nr:hypothetical protein [Oligoflexus sp.]HYX38111.1 hypothetical protein [Oligoflexus sp.]
MTKNRRIIERQVNLNELGKSLLNIAEVYRYLGTLTHESSDIKNVLKTEGVAQVLERFKGNMKNPRSRLPISKDIETKVLAYATQWPTHGKDRVCSEMKRRGIIISAGSVRGIWLKHGLETKEQRLRQREICGTVEAVAQERSEEVEQQCKQPEGPAHLLVQDTYFVGYIRGIGKIYQQTAIDCYSHVGFAKLYPQRTALSAADLLNDRVLPYFDQCGLQVQRIITDFSTEFSGVNKSHPYQVFLHINEIAHVPTSLGQAEAFGMIRQFNHMLQKTFYDAVLKTRRYTSLEELQHDLDAFMSLTGIRRVSDTPG